MRGEVNAICLAKDGPLLSAQKVLLQMDLAPAMAMARPEAGAIVIACNVHG